MSNDTKAIGDAITVRRETGLSNDAICTLMAVVTKPTPIRYQLALSAVWSHPVLKGVQKRMDRRWREDGLELLLARGIDSLRDEMGFNSNALKSEAIQVIRDAVYNAEDSILTQGQGETK